jgi:RNA binding exosome subunit
MDQELFNSLTVLNSRIENARSLRKFYEFTPEELETYTLNIIEICATIADENHINYVKLSKMLAKVVLKNNNTGDLIRDYFK